jgi:hypothetical protein
MRANASEGRLQDALKTALADRQNAVDAGGLLGDIIEIWGAPAAWRLIFTASFRKPQSEA